MMLEDLRAGYDSLHRELEGKPSKYAKILAGAASTEMNDSLPDHSAPPVADVAPKSLEEKLIADLANLNTPGDCTLWALQVSNMEELPDDVFGRVNKALMKRQAERLEGARNRQGGQAHRRRRRDRHRLNRAF
jgi:hypothetical protein